MQNKPTFIAEVKPQSPGWKSDRNWDQLFEIAKAVGDWVSIHTHHWWGGDFCLIAEARKRTEKPILAKGFHHTDDEIKRAVDLGADYVLVVGRIPEVHQEKCLIEPYDLEEFKMIPKEFKIVWNSRDIRALINKTPPQPRPAFEDVRKLRPDVWLCQASNLEDAYSVKAGADAILVGTHLPKFARSFIIYNASP